MASIEAQLTKLKEQQKVSLPKKYNVLLLNDNYTPMDFVVEILIDIFFMPHVQAYQVMMKIHREESAVCGIYSIDIARTKQKQVMDKAYSYQYPLQCIIEDNI